VYFLYVDNALINGMTHRLDSSRVILKNREQKESKEQESRTLTFPLVNYCYLMIDFMICEKAIEAFVPREEKREVMSVFVTEERISMKSVETFCCNENDDYYPIR
jgi:hypothetical protein